MLREEGQTTRNDGTLLELLDEGGLRAQIFEDLDHTVSSLHTSGLIQRKLVQKESQHLDYFGVAQTQLDLLVLTLSQYHQQIQRLFIVISGCIPCGGTLRCCYLCDACRTNYPR